MKPPALSLDPYRGRGGGSWLARAGRSHLFAWVVSLGLHGAVFLVLYLAVFREEAPPRRFIIPEARLAGPAGQAPRETSERLELSRRPAPSPSDAIPVTLDELPMAAITMNESAPFALPGDDLPDPSGSITSETMVSSPAAGPVSRFFGQAGNAYKVVYVVDVSVSLMTYMEDIIREMRRSIRDLVPSQRFHIVIAAPLRVEEFAPRRLVPAIGKYKAEAMTYLDSITNIWDAGKADPIAAMKRAFAAGPELIYFLSDGDYSDLQDDLLQTLRELNSRKQVKITVIGFSRRPRDLESLERIAAEHGGHFRVVESP